MSGTVPGGVGVSTLGPYSLSASGAGGGEGPGSQGPELAGTGLTGGEAGLSPHSSPSALGGGGGGGCLWGGAVEDTRALPCSCLGQVSEMQKLDAQVKELVLKSAVEAERLVAGKLKKDTYIENEKLISGKRQELVTKIDHILDAL